MLAASAQRLTTEPAPRQQDDHRIKELKAAAEKGDAAALNDLFWLAYNSTIALNTLGDSSVLKPVSRQISVWPILASNAPSVIKKNNEYFKAIELGKEAKSFDAVHMFAKDPVGRKYAFGLLNLIHQIRVALSEEPHLLPTEVQIALPSQSGPIAAPPEFLAACANLPALSKSTTKQWNKVVKSLLELLTQDRYHEVPELRKPAIRSATKRANGRRGNSVESMLRGDILTRIYAGVKVAAAGNSSKKTNRRKEV